jgi:hypothetical protein
MHGHTALLGHTYINERTPVPLCGIHPSAPVLPKRAASKALHAALFGETAEQGNTAGVRQIKAAVCLSLPI